MSRIKKILAHKYVVALLLFHAVFAAVVIANFPHGKFFIGWDALDPEFNFGLNFARALSAPWQENYGVGALTGHGFATTLPHVIITYAMSWILPMWAIRPAFTFLCLYLGGLGMFVLLTSVLTSDAALFYDAPWMNKIGVLRHRLNPEHTQWIADSWTYAVPFVALAGALFYMLNLGTVQIFYVQLETFIGQYAALPWLFWSVICLTKQMNRKNVAIFLIINFFATLQGFIPSLFVAYAVALVLFLGMYCLSQGFSKHSLLRSLSVLILTGFVNAYWLLPMVYYELTHATTFLDAYNNLSSTQHFIDVNKKYGDFFDVALLKSYLFDSFELGNYILAPWISHLTGFGTTLIGFGAFLIIVIGVVISFLSKTLRKGYNVLWVLPGFGLVFLFFFASMATNTFPFSVGNALLQHISPTYEQAFRTTFTKFGIGTSFIYSFFFGIGLLTVLKVLLTFWHKQWIVIATLAGTIIALIIFAYPAFTGNFLYQKLDVSIPKPYFDMMQYFKGQDYARIADFPQECPEGWYTYNWGYFGSGFLWYGIKQPILSRSFDVWSSGNENYYWEISQALQEQNYTAADSILQKYNVKWVLYDPNILRCRDQKGYIDDTTFINHLASSSHFKLVKTFSDGKILPIKVYENTDYHTENYVNSYSSLPTVGSTYDYSDNDSAYADYGTYENGSVDSSQIYYPFNTLFTKRGTMNPNLSVSVTDHELVFQSTLPKSLQNNNLLLKSYASLEQSVPAIIHIENKGNNQYDAVMTVEGPEIDLDEKKLIDYTSTVDLGTFQTSDNIKAIQLFINAQQIARDSDGTYTGVLYFRPNDITIMDSQGPVLEWSDSTDTSYQTLLQQGILLQIPPFTTGKLAVHIKKVVDGKMEGVSLHQGFAALTPSSCYEPTPSSQNKYLVGTQDSQQYVQMTSTDSSQCLVIHVGEALTNFGYLAQVNTTHISGNDLQFSVANNSRVAVNPVSLTHNTSLEIIPPSFKDGVSYDVVLNNISENNSRSINEFTGIDIWHFPYAFISTMQITTPNTVISDGVPSPVSLSVAHPIDTFYTVTPHETLQKDTVISLAQAYDAGWDMYRLPQTNNTVLRAIFGAMPMVFGHHVGNHVEINNWSNGWVLQTPLGKNDSTEIVYLPQYLEYAGFVFILIAIDIFINPFAQIQNVLKKKIRGTHTTSIENSVQI